MSNGVLDRITQQIKEKTATPVRFQQPHAIEVPPMPLSPPLSLEELKNILNDEIKEPAPIVTCQPEANPHERTFNGIEDFACWYIDQRDHFSEQQREALNTLLHARDMIYAGCKCKTDERRIEAQKYFRVFWTNNQHTDLPKKVSEVLGVPRVKFASNEEVFVDFAI